MFLHFTNKRLTLEQQYAHRDSKLNINWTKTTHCTPQPRYTSDHHSTNTPCCVVMGWTLGPYHTEKFSLESDQKERKTFESKLSRVTPLFSKVSGFRKWLLQDGPSTFCKRTLANEALWLVQSALFINNRCYLPLFRKKLSHKTLQCVNFRKFFFKSPFHAFSKENFSIWHVLQTQPWPQLVVTRD